MQWVVDLSFRERERESYFSLDFHPFGPSVRFGPRSKDVTRQRLRVGIDFVEFRQLQEVRIFSYLVYSLAKGHFMDEDLLRHRRPCYRSQKL